MYFCNLNHALPVGWAEDGHLDRSYPNSKTSEKYVGDNGQTNAHACGMLPIKATIILGVSGCPLPYKDIPKFPELVMAT